jgi:hypothetical protein
MTGQFVRIAKMAEFTFPDADMVDQPVLTHGGNAIALSEQIGFRRNARALGLISPLGRALGSDRLNLQTVPPPLL